MGNASGYSPVVSNGGEVTVELDEDHPGFADPIYRERRNEIASLSIGHKAGDPIPRIEYTDQEHEVWRVVARELRPKHERFGCEQFVAAMEELQLPTDHIPQLGEVTERLKPLTGFSYESVAGLAPVRDFYGAFRDRNFFSTQYIRHHSVPLYTPEPDIVHEVIGHANQIADPRFADIYEEVGKAVARTESSEALGFLSKVFWFTLEFGVVFEKGEPKAYGAGILSSFGELDVFQQAEIRPLDFPEMGTMHYDITHYQPVLYSARSFDELTEQLTAFYGGYDDAAYRRFMGERTSSAA
jgi:phenylalanine-4-hydroxylase